MKRITQKQKLWMASVSRKEIRKLQRQKRFRLRAARLSSADRERILHKNEKPHRIIAPQSLSIFSNPTATLAFFGEVDKSLHELGVRQTLYFDLSTIETVTVDAIMYLIALIKNTKRAKTLHINCAGNMPANKTARDTFETCGFYNYVSPNYNPKKTMVNDHISITQGKEADPLLAGEICAFIHAHSNFGRSDTKSLFAMILELMANTRQHAYNGDCRMENNWYIFVEDNKDYLSFVFLDTGEGIPNTIQTKGLLERIQNRYDWKDAFFIASALRGEWRSETKLEYRGKGLPEIYNRALSNYIIDFSIVSGKGKCTLDDNGRIIETNQTNALTGTMLCWKLKKAV